jgi:CheY-like chemotaxis protein
MNLLVNARDAMPHGGTLRVETAVVDREGRSFVRVAVADTGVGMDDETRSRMFEPFFTTKGEQRTGLGLATVYGIVSQSEGTIDVDSAPGRGTTVAVFLPACDVPAPTLAAAEAVGQHSRGTETVMVVEDEDGVRSMIRSILRRAGYTVIDVSNPGEAILACEQHEGPIEAIVSDVILPRMRGAQLVARVKQLRPDIEEVFVTGYADAETLRDLTQPPLMKPFTVDALLARVRDALDRRVAGGRS